MQEVENFFLYHVQEEKLIELEDGMVLGRSRENEYPITDDLVSSRHLKISIRDGNAFLTDLRSQNHTIINGHQLTPLRKYLLNEDDKVKVGDQKFIFTRDGQQRSFTAQEASVTANFSLGNNTQQKFKMGQIVAPKLVASIKSHSDYLGQLKQNRVTLNVLEESLKTVEEKMARLDLIQEEFGEAQEKSGQYNEKLGTTHLETEKQFEAEVENFEKGLQAAEDKITESKKIIERMQKEMAMLLEKSEQTKELHELFLLRKTAVETVESMEDEIKQLTGENLKIKRSEIVRDLRQETKRYKEIQEVYGNSIGNKKNKMSLDKKMLLDKK